MDALIISTAGNFSADQLCTQIEEYERLAVVWAGIHPAEQNIREYLFVLWKALDYKLCRNI